MRLMIEEFNPVLLEGDDLYENWLAICCELAGKKGVPLREWIEKKPVFTFSR